MAETGNCEWNERMTKAHSKLKQLIDVLSDMEHITNGFDEGRNLVENTPTADVVENDEDFVARGAYEQIKWERDVAMEQINEAGIPFGGKADVVEAVRCEHCKHSWFNGVSLWLCQRESNFYCPTVKADDFCSYGERKEETP